MSTPTKSVVPPTQCKICDREFKSAQGLGVHVAHAHKMHKADYYHTYIDSNAGKCLACNSQTKLISLVQGYLRFCSSACSNTDAALIEERNNSSFETHQKDPSIRINALIKLTKTLETNPSILINRMAKLAKTIAENPHIKVNAGKKISEAYQKKDTHLKEQAIKKQKETLSNNPHIMKNIHEKRKRT